MARLPGFWVDLWRSVGQRYVNVCESAYASTQIGCSWMYLDVIVSHVVEFRFHGNSKRFQVGKFRLDSKKLYSRTLLCVKTLREHCRLRGATHNCRLSSFLGTLHQDTWWARCNLLHRSRLTELRCEFFAVSRPERQWEATQQREIRFGGFFSGRLRLVSGRPLSVVGWSHPDCNGHATDLQPTCNGTELTEEGV